MAEDYDGSRTTGFASPASDSLEGPIDLSEILDLRRPHRYPVRVRGDALTERGIRHGDILIADAAAPPAAGRVVIAMVHGEVLVCQLRQRHGTWWLQTNPHNGDPWHSGQRAARIEPTSDTRDLIREAVRMLRPLWRGGFRYFKAGVILNDLVPAARQPGMLFASRDAMQSARVMAAMDAVNARYGRGALRPISTGIERSWGSRQSRLSPRYTTQASEMLEAVAW